MKTCNLRETIEKSIKHQSDPNGNIINLTKHSFTKAEYKLFETKQTQKMDSSE